MSRQMFKPRDQVAYVPTHANGDLDHHDVEFGFVTSVKGDTVFCRYWTSQNKFELRTKANSEGCNWTLLEKYAIHDQKFVDEMFYYVTL